MPKIQMTQQEFLRDAMHRLDMTRDEFADRIAVKRKTLDNWILPPSDSRGACQIWRGSSFKKF